MRPGGSGRRLVDCWGEQAQQRREEFLADEFGGESARQLQGTGASGEGELAEGFQLREIQGEAVGMAEAAQDAALQGERLCLEEM